jgi:hypothetical protein
MKERQTNPKEAAEAFLGLIIVLFLISGTIIAIHWMFTRWW